MKETALSDLVGINLSKAPLLVKHTELERAQEDSPHKSICPSCKEGHLLMQRNPATMLLTNKDYCILCGQHFVYSDIPDNQLTTL